jgi:hypothetical protein
MERTCYANSICLGGKRFYVSKRSAAMAALTCMNLRSRGIGDDAQEMVVELPPLPLSSSEVQTTLRRRLVQKTTPLHKRRRLFKKTTPPTVQPKNACQVVEDSRVHFWRYRYLWEKEWVALRPQGWWTRSVGCRLELNWSLR